MPPPMTRKSARRNTECYSTSRLRARPNAAATTCPPPRSSSRLRPRRMRFASAQACWTNALGEELEASAFPRRRILVSSPVVWRLFGDRVQASLPGVPVVLAPDGERHKNLKTVSTIYDAFLRLGADRGTGIVAVGGGVLGDSAGFAAASFLRGLALAQVPTTLLAQVDSSVGGKVGVNHPLGKNLIGAFHQPRLVAVDPLVLETLPRREFRAGLYEVVKYGMTSSRDLFDRVHGHVSRIFRRSPEVMTPLIAESCRIKAEVVAADEREGGVRRVLNFGHTAGHALEAVTKYKRLRHGEAKSLARAWDCLEDRKRILRGGPPDSCPRAFS